MQKKQIKNVSDLKFLYFCKTFVALTYVTKSRERGTLKMFPPLPCKRRTNTFAKFTDINSQTDFKGLRFIKRI